MVLAYENSKFEECNKKLPMISYIADMVYFFRDLLHGGLVLDLESDDHLCNRVLVECLLVKLICNMYCYGLSP